MVGLGIPYTALGKLDGDSGFIEIMEPLAHIAEKYNVKSVIYVDKRFDGKLEVPPKGIEFLTSSVKQEAYTNNYKWAMCCDLAFGSFPGSAVFPVDFVFTNKKHVASTMAALGLDKRAKTVLIPIILDVLKVGVDTHDVVYDEILKHEAMSYASVHGIVFSTEREKALGLQVARKYLSSAQVKQIEAKAVVQGDGISPDLLKVKRTPEKVKALAQSRKEKIKLAFIGRTNTNKGIDDIVAAVRPLFALHGLKLTLVTPSAGLPTAPVLKDMGNLLEDVLTHVPKWEFVNKVLPSCDLILNASHHEGFTVSVAEAVFAGIPVLLPKRSWAVALVGADYPFFYSGTTEMYALVKRFVVGKISDTELLRFEDARDLFVKELSSDCGEVLYSIALREVEKVDAIIQKEAHGRILEAFFNKIHVGQVFTIAEAMKVYPNLKTRDRIGYDGWSIYKFIKPFCEPISAKVGSFRRVL
mgnify:CR=1 FL=1